MKKTLFLAALAVLTVTQLFAASYWVVMKDGTRYEARAKWTIVNGKARMTLTNGSVPAPDPSATAVPTSGDGWGGASRRGTETGADVESIRDRQRDPSAQTDAVATRRRGAAGCHGN